MADTPKLTAPRIRVVMDDGSEHHVQALNVDMLAWDRTRVKHSWPQADQAPFIWMTYLGWHILVREKAITMGQQEFEQHCLEVSVIAEDAVDPTQQAAGAG